MLQSQLLPLLRQLYAAADSLSSKLTSLHAERLQCRQGCSACCLDDLTVFSLEAENIAQANTGLLQQESPHTAGSCAFLDKDGGCRIYASRPLVCRTQGLPLSWSLEDEAGMISELRDICPLNEAGEPLDELAAHAVFPLSPFEEKLALLQLHYDGGKLERKALRELFSKTL